MTTRPPEGMTVEEWESHVVSLYSRRGWGLVRIAGQFGVSTIVVTRILRQHRVKTRPSGLTEAARKRRREWKALRAQGFTLDQIAHQAGVTRQAVHAVLKAAAKA